MGTCVWLLNCIVLAGFGSRGARDPRVRYALDMYDMNGNLKQGVVYKRNNNPYLIGLFDLII